MKGKNIIIARCIYRIDCFGFDCWGRPEKRDFERDL